MHSPTLPVPLSLVLQRDPLARGSRLPWGSTSSWYSPCMESYEYTQSRHVVSVCLIWTNADSLPFTCQVGDSKWSFPLPRRWCSHGGICYSAVINRRRVIKSSYYFRFRMLYGSESHDTILVANNMSGPIKVSSSQFHVEHVLYHLHVLWRSYLWMMESYIFWCRV